MVTKRSLTRFPVCGSRREVRPFQESSSRTTCTSFIVVDDIRLVQRDFLVAEWRRVRGYPLCFLPFSLVGDEKPLFATAEWFYDFVLHFDRFVQFS